MQRARALLPAVLQRGGTAPRRSSRSRPLPGSQGRPGTSRVAVLDLGRQRDAVAGEASNAPDEAPKVEARGENLLAVCFTAMTSPCELLLPSTEDEAALEWGTLVAQEAWRVEKKLSRYRSDSVPAWIHESRGIRIEVDPETASL